MAEAKVGRIENTLIKHQAAHEDEWYDLLPIEKKLISYSLGLGIVLLVIFLFAFGLK